MKYYKVKSLWRYAENNLCVYIDIKPLFIWKYDFII